MAKQNISSELFMVIYENATPNQAMKSTHNFDFYLHSNKMLMLRSSYSVVVLGVKLMFETTRIISNV